MGQGLDESLCRLLSDRDDGLGPGAPPDDKDVTANAIAREFGTTPRALRLYEEKGLLSPRRQGVARLYGRIERERLNLVLKAKRLGFTLREIRLMLAESAGSSETGALGITRKQCFDQIKLLEGRKRDIEAALGELRATYSSFYARIAAGAV